MNTDTIEKNVVLRAPLERVWRAVSDADEFGTWFGIKFDGSFKPKAEIKGTLIASSPEYDGLVFDFVIEQVEPNELFSFRWHPSAIERDKDYSSEPMTLVEFKLKEVPEGVALTVKESGFDKIPLERRAKAFSGNTEGWEYQIKEIEEYLSRAA